MTVIVGALTPSAVTRSDLVGRRVLLATVQGSLEAGALMPEAGVEEVVERHLVLGAPQRRYQPTSSTECGCRNVAAEAQSGRCHSLIVAGRRGGASKRCPYPEAAADRRSRHACKHRISCLQVSTAHARLAIKRATPERPAEAPRRLTVTSSYLPQIGDRVTGRDGNGVSRIGYVCGPVTVAGDPVAVADLGVIFLPDVQLADEVQR